MSHHQSYGAARLLHLVPLMRGWSLSLPLSLLFQKTSATAHDWLASHGLTCQCSATVCGQDGIEQVEASPAHGPRRPAPADAEGPAATIVSRRTSSLHARANRLTLTEPFLPKPSTSQALLVVFHTARDNKVVARAEMPSPSAKLKAARRLPKRLRISGEAPDGDIARMRDEAAERYERGESSSSTLHSCLQKTHKGWKGKRPDWGSNSHWSWHGQWTASWSGGYDWEEGAERQHLWRSEASPSSAQPSSGQPPVDEPDSHSDRPMPPTPPTPRRLKKELAKLTEDGASHEESAKEETARVMAAVKSKPRSTRNRSKGTSPGANAAATGVAGEAGSHAGEAGDAVANRPQSRSLVQETVERPNQPDMQPPATAIALEGEGSATSRCSNPDRPETTAENARRERRRVRSSTLSNDSDDVAVVLSDWAPGSQPEMLTGSHPRGSAASGSLAKASASTGPSREDRPEASKWTPEDTKLSKAMSRLLRHKSNLKLDEAGYAKLSDMLEHPRLRDMKPTKERMMHVVQHNFK